MVSTKRKRILIEFGLPYFELTRDRIWGIFDYAQRHCPEWDFMTDPFDFFQAFRPGYVAPEKTDGAFISTMAANKTTVALVKHSIPAINLGYPNTQKFSIPCVSLDHEAIGRLAGEHLIRPLISKTIYFGPDYLAGRVRLRGFQKALKEAGKPPPEVVLESQEMQLSSPRQRSNHIKAALKQHRPKRPQKMGVFAFSDSFAHAVIEACHELKIETPNEVVVLGCDNETIICGLSKVSLSSIPVNGRKQGFVAAEMLHAVMQGKEIAKLTLVEPLPVVERLSSSHLLVEDPIVAKALGIIREKAHTGLKVYELLEYIQVSRRNLESRFRTTVGSSPHDEIEKVRIELAFQILKDASKTNAKIAFECGFGSAIHFEQAFRKFTGHPPSYFRRK